MLTRSGVLVLPENDGAPTLNDIGWGLARMPRFGGQTETWYSVLPHVYTVSALVPDEYKLDALLHDAAEVVVSDQVSTWKNPFTKEDEILLLKRIYGANGLQYDDQVFKQYILTADLAARAAEAYLLGHTDASLFNIVDEDMHERALIYTRNNMDMFHASKCVIQTDAMARGFERIVQAHIDKLKVTQ